MALIHIENWPQQALEAGRQRILEAALDAGVPFPHACGSGECGSCKCRLLEGRVSSDPHSPGALSAEEAAQGLILACRARPLGDIRIQWLSAERPRPMVKLIGHVESLDRLAPEVVRVRLKLPAGRHLDFHAGQFAKLRFGRLPVRSYSMAQRPGEAGCEFHVRVLADGQVSRFVSTQLRVGAPVEIRAPFGEAYWRGVSPGRVVLVGGGTGLAPMMSILAAALHDGQPPPSIHVYHGARTAHDLYASAKLRTRAERHGFHYHEAVVHEPAPAMKHGHIHDVLARDFTDLRDAQVYVAGPPPMVDAVQALAVARGANPAEVRADPFHAAPPQKRSLWERVTGFAGL